MDTRTALLERLYERFNARDIDGVLCALTPDVAWANGMDGGHVHGHEGLRAYWTAQWQAVDPHVAAVGFEHRPDGAVMARVVQTIRDLDGNPLGNGQTHDLTDKTVGHLFRFEGDRVARFDIEEVPPTDLPDGVCGA